MNGGYLGKYRLAFFWLIFFGFLNVGLITIGLYLILQNQTQFGELTTIIIGGVSAIIFGATVAWIYTKVLTKPTENLHQTILHISPNQNGDILAPDNSKLHFGGEMVESLSRQLYEYVDVVKNLKGDQPVETNLLDDAPVSIIGLDDAKKIVFINQVAEKTFDLDSPISQDLYAQLTFKFNNETLEDWINQAKDQSINSNKIWRKIEVSNINGENRSYYDIAVNYRLNHSTGITTLIALFNHNNVFEAEDNALNIIALSMHEIRTPLTIVRGYTDALKDDLSGKLNDDSQQSLDRLTVASRNLSTFLSNVLNVVRADQSQLNFVLKDHAWAQVLNKIGIDIQDRAKVKGKKVMISVDENLPNVAIDIASISEVLTNLVDNAIKYSPKGKDNILIKSSLDGEGNIVTSVIDEGVGIPESVVPNLFDRFHRNHRNSSQVYGTGLGLYLSKAIVSAHHGNIWVSSKEGQGTTVSFTLIPFEKLPNYQSQGASANKITHGWIKNHGMQRR